MNKDSGTILIVDDEKEIADLLEVYLTNDNYSVYKFYNGTDALRCIEENDIDLAILDVMLPDTDGFQLCQKIRENFYFPVIMLTAKIEDNDKIMGLTIGADDYITKPFGVGELLARVEAHLRREQREKHSSLNLGNIRFDLSSNQVFVKEEEIHLTKSEYQISKLLAKRKGQVFSREQIYEMIFGFDGIGDSSAISEHVKNIRAKFLKFGENPISTVWGIGYKWN